MMASQCPHEDTLLDAVARGQWPSACERELVEHVEGCRDCSELALVVDALVTDRRVEERATAIPTSGAVWWRMQLRREREAKVVAARTVGRVHGAVIGLTVAMIAVVLVMTSLGRVVWGWIASTLPRVEEITSLSAALPLTVAVLIVAAILVFAPVAVYLALVED